LGVSSHQGQKAIAAGRSQLRFLFGNLSVTKQQVMVQAFNCVTHQEQQPVCCALLTEQQPTDHLLDLCAKLKSLHVVVFVWLQ